MNGRVLIIDDEENVRRMMRFTLEAAGYEVGEAKTGPEGLDTFDEGPPWDAVLLDQKMPGMDGLETLRRLRERAADARVIMVTAFASIDLAVDAMKLGATDFLRKPMTPEALRGAVAAALSKTPSRDVAAGRPQLTVKRPPGEIWTVNGFFIARLPSQAGAPSTEHRFQVRHAERGPQGEVVVSIDPAEVAKVDRLTKRQLEPAGAFWRQRTELALIDYLYREARLPDEGRLPLPALSRMKLDEARDWKDEA